MGMSEKSKTNKTAQADQTDQTANKTKKGLIPLATLKVNLNQSIITYIVGKYDVKQSFLLTDIKIFLGALAVILACIVTYISVTKDFKATYYQQFYLIVGYFATNGVYEVLNRMYRIDKLILSGTTSSKTINVYNEKNAHDDYHLEYTIVTGSTTTKKLGTIYDYYDVDGNLQLDVVERNFN